MKRPKWSLNCVPMAQWVSVATWGELKYWVETHPDIPDDAHIEFNDYEMRVTWFRDMSYDEYEKEKKRRREGKMAARERDRAHLEQLAEKLNVKIVEKG